jgi:uncharacterized protein (TIGR02611 family)
MEDARRPRRRLLEGVRERRERHLERNRVIRVGIAAFGFLVVLAGLAMLVLPGPGLLVIAIGLGILALEFAWAERLLERTVHRLETAADTVKDASRTQQLLLAMLAAVGSVGLLAVVLLWDVPFLPF